MSVIKETLPPGKLVQSNGKEVRCYDDLGKNIDSGVVESFGEEWQAFHDFSERDLQNIGAVYFDLLTNDMCGPEKTAIDFGCGTGRWTKYIHKRFGQIAAVDPSNAIFAATHLLEATDNVIFYKASIDNLPFEDDSFDFGFSLGVLHHIPDTAKAMADCVKKIRTGGYFLVYLYYDFEDRSAWYRTLHKASDTLRKMVCRLPSRPKRAVCDVLAVTTYMPFVFINRALRAVGVPKKIRQKVPLHSYESTSFYIIRNDSLDRFGTSLEQRFSRKDITQMMENAGLSGIRISEEMPYWHAIGQKQEQK